MVWTLAPPLSDTPLVGDFERLAVSIPASITQDLLLYQSGELHLSLPSVVTGPTE
jgi:hypothetical protein